MVVGPEVRDRLAIRTERTTLTCLEICAGAGGQALGLEQAEFQHQAVNEIDARACQTLRRNRPNWNTIEVDVRTVSGLAFEGIDLLSGGIPCPPFSVAGKQLGVNDDRDLFPEVLRLAAECRPKGILVENVPGLLHPRFDSYRDEIGERLMQLGMVVVGWRMLNASDFGVPQLRPRVALIALQPEYIPHFQWPETNEELSRMVLSIEQLPPEYRAVVPDEENGVLTLDKAVESTHDPEGLRAQLVEYGWESGYVANYLPVGDEPLSGPSFVLSRVDAFKTSDGASASRRPSAPTDGSESPSSTLSPSDAARFAETVHRFEVDLGDEAGGFRLETLLDRDKGLTDSSAFITFRRGRLIGKVSVSAYNLSDKEAKELENTAKDLARKMNDHMSEVLAPER